MKYKNGSKSAAMANNFRSFFSIFSNNLKTNSIEPKKILEIISLKKIVVVGFNDSKTWVDQIYDMPQKIIATTPPICTMKFLFFMLQKY